MKKNENQCTDIEDYIMDEVVLDETYFPESDVAILEEDEQCPPVYELLGTRLREQYTE
jgi:hypothetical protein